jgi:NAD/NADP transhydrogenase alpha subunit
MEIYILLGFGPILSIYLGLELISKVPSTPHTPLMAGANAISRIAPGGTLTLTQDTFLSTGIAFLTITFASLMVLVATWSLIGC